MRTPNKTAKKPAKNPEVETPVEQIEQIDTEPHDQVDSESSIVAPVDDAIPMVDWRCLPSAVRAICLIEHTRSNIQRVMRYTRSLSFASEDGISRRYRVVGVDRTQEDAPVKLLIGYPAMQGRIAEIASNKASRAQWAEEASIAAYKQRRAQLQDRLKAEQADWKSRGLEYPPQQTAAYEATMANIALTIESCQKRADAARAELEAAQKVVQRDVPSQVVCWVYPERQLCQFVN